MFVLGFFVWKLRLLRKVWEGMPQKWEAVPQKWQGVPLFAGTLHFQSLVRVDGTAVYSALGMLIPR